MLTRLHVLIAAAAACAVLAIPSVASAEDFCVGVPAGCTGSPVAANGLKAALTGAQSNGTEDRFFLAPGVYSADTFRYQSAERVQIIGAGAGKTVLRGSLADDAVLWLEGGPDSSVSSLTVEPTGGMTTGLLLAGAHARRVSIGVTGAGFSGYGAFLLGGATFDEGRVDLGMSSGYGVVVAYSGAVTDSTVRAAVGVEALAGTATVRRSTLRAATGAIADGSRLTMTDSVIDTAGIGVVAGPGWGSVGTTATVDLDRVTIAGGKIGAFAAADETGENAALHVRDSVISGSDTPVARSATGGATAATVSTDRSVYPAPATPVDVGPGKLVETRHMTVSPRFVDDAAHDFRPAAGSPLVDAGTPGSVPADATDRDGRPRASDGDGNCTHVPDIGAFEYQGTKVRATARAAAATTSTGRPVGFSAAGSCVPGPGAPTIRWSFSDGAAAIGATVTHAFRSPGRHTATATVSDHGHQASATASVEVAAPAAGTPAARPKISRLRVAPTRVQIGTRLPRLVRRAVRRPLATIRFRLSERAAVTLRFARLSSKGAPRTIAAKVRMKARRGRNRIRFAARLSRRVALEPGAYRLTMVATDAAGNRSRPAKTRFNAVNPARR